MLSYSCRSITKSVSGNTEAYYHADSCASALHYWPACGADYGIVYRLPYMWTLQLSLEKLLYSAPHISWVRCAKTSHSLLGLRGIGV